jgi:mycoredoxin-dependent peroxiredoxin
MQIKEGVAAPDFSLAAHNTDQKVSLASFKGRPTVVAFMPFAFTPGWTNQVNGFRANYEEFKKLNCEILQISADPVPSLKGWAEKLGGVPFPLLSDYWPHGAVGKAYDIFNEERGMDKRAAYVLDAKGVVRYAKVYEPGKIPESAELLEQLRKLWAAGGKRAGRQAGFLRGPLPARFASEIAKNY